MKSQTKTMLHSVDSFSSSGQNLKAFRLLKTEYEMGKKKKLEEWKKIRKTFFSMRW